MSPARKRDAPWNGSVLFSNGNMAVMRPRRGNRGCVVPMHREISRGTLKGILEQAGISVEEFLDAL
jgi:HicA toxin of bacterial toxin-antitoxin,